MATINGYTAERMKEIEDAAIVDGDVVGDNLILKRFDGGEINAGSVRGPQGIPGITDLEPYLLVVSPIGQIAAFGGVVAPTGWLMCNGASYLRADYQDLFDVIGTAYGAADGTHFNVPDLRQRVPMGLSPTAPGDVLGGSGGSKDLIVPGHTHTTTGLGAHTHTTGAAGTHGHTTGTNGSHDHTVQAGAVFVVSIGGPQNERIAEAGDPVTGPWVTYDSVDAAGDHSHGTDSQGNHQHGTDSQGSHSHTAQSSGVSGTNENLAPYVVVNYIIRY